jgi:PAS domain S-box-containing protein
VAVIVAVVMTVFEAVKTWIHPAMSLWTSHSITIVFSTLVGTLAAWWVLRRQASLERVLAVEAGERALAEQARAVLTAQADALEASAASLRAEIAERERAEAALREEQRRRQALLDAMPDAFVVVGHDGRIREVHADAAGLAGWRPAPDWVGRRWADVLPAEAAEAIVQRVVRGLAGSPPQPEELTLLPPPDGSGRPRPRRRIDVRVARVNDGEALVLLRDMTDRHELEEQLLHAQKMEGIGRLAGGVAHDFNNLLTAVVAHTDFVEQALPTGHSAKDDVDGIRNAATLATSLTRRLLAFARREMADVRVHDLARVVEGLEHLLRRTVGAAIDLRLLGPGEGLAVEADAGHLEQVVLNLVINARDAMPAGGSLTLQLDPVTLAGGASSPLPAGRYARLEVRDSGTGMSPDVRARVFEPFFTTKGPDRGTGLGLSTCYGIVQRYGGHIAVSSEEGVGSTFTVWLPLAGLPLADAVTSPAGSTGRVGGVAVLAEDDPMVRAVARRALEGCGLAVVEAADGRQALAVLEGRSAPPDLLLTDVVMPGLTGPELVAQVRQRWPSVRVLFMSGYLPEDAFVGHPVPAESAFVAKPFSPRALAERVRTMLAVSATAA